MVLQVYKIDKKNRTRKKNKNKMAAEHFYYYVEDIIKHLQKGVGKYKQSTIKQSKHPKTIEFKQKLIDLGWSPTYVIRTFMNLQDKYLDNWPYHLLIQEMFSRYIRLQGWKNTIHESLMGIGLREDIAMKLEIILEPLLDSSYTHEQILDIAIEYLLGRYDPLTPPTARFLHHPEIINEWFEIKVKDKSYLICNIPYYCNDKIVKKVIDTHLIPSNNYDYYFHATSWNGSNNIMKRISRSAGRFCLDFGKQPGFYLGTTLKDSIQWCTRQQQLWSNETSILIFQIPKELPPTISIKYIEGDEWIAVTKESRECDDKDNEIESLWDYDLLYGNMVSNPINVRNRDALPTTHTPPKQQLVGKTDKAERFLQRCLIGCIYFQKNNE